MRVPQFASEEDLFSWDAGIPYAFPNFLLVSWLSLGSAVSTPECVLSDLPYILCTD
jgi:hypothetical protein